MSRKLEIRAPHKKDKAALKKVFDKRLDSLLIKYSRQFSLLERKWEADSLTCTGKLFGISVGGQMTIGNNEVVITLPVPGILAPLQEKADNRIKQELNKILALV